LSDGGAESCRFPREMLELFPKADPQKTATRRRGLAELVMVLSE